MSVTEYKSNVIMDAAFDLFGTKGFYETKMSDIAEQAGIAKGTIYLYFTSKDELFLAITKRDLNRFLVDLDLSLQFEVDLNSQLLAVANHYLWHFYKLKDYKRLLFQAPNNDPRLWEMLEVFILAYQDKLSRIMERSLLPDPLSHAKAFHGLLEGFKMDILHSPHVNESMIDDKSKFVVSIFLQGCGKNL